MENDIEKHEDDNLGGVNSFRFIFADEVETIPPVVDGAIRMELKPYYFGKWNTGYCTEFTMKFTDVPVISDQGTSYEKEFSGVVPKDRVELIALFNRIKNRKFILDIIDNNGTRKLVGNKEEPMYGQFGLDTKSQMSDRNEYKIVFKGTGIDLSPVYDV